MPAPDPSILPAAYEWQEAVHELPGGLDLHFGGRLDRVELAYRVAGARGAPVVAVLGGISAGRNVFSLQPGAPGWWEDAIGPGRALDTDRYRVLGIDFLAAVTAARVPTSARCSRRSAPSTRRGCSSP